MSTDFLHDLSAAENVRLTRWLDAIEDACIEFIFEGEQRNLGPVIQAMIAKARAGEDAPELE